MESFAKLMSAIGASQYGVDFVDSLPVELAELILRRLDPRSLLNVARVSRKWMAVCKSDSQLRRTARHYLRKEKRLMFQNRFGSKQRITKEQAVSRTVRMQADLAQRISRQAYAVAPPVRIARVIETDKKSAVSKKLSNKQNPASCASKILTRSSLKLR